MRRSRRHLAAIACASALAPDAHCGMGLDPTAHRALGAALGRYAEG